MMDATVSNDTATETVAVFWETLHTLELTKNKARPITTHCSGVAFSAIMARNVIVIRRKSIAIVSVLVTDQFLSNIKKLRDGDADAGDAPRRLRANDILGKVVKHNP